MSKRQINFTGPSIQELGINMKEDGKSKNNNAVFTNANNEKNTITKNDNSNNKNTKKHVLEISDTKHDNSNNSITYIGNTQKRNTLQYRMIRNYLDTALGDSEKIEVKLSEICEELGINLKTFYKHLKSLRETEFVLTKLQYGTEIKRRK